NCVEQGTMADDTFRMARHINKKIKFLGCQMGFFSADRHNSFLEINMEISYLYGPTWRLFHASGRTAQTRPDSRQQLVNTEWLGDVIVRSLIQCLDFALVLASYRKNYDRNLRAIPNLFTQFNSGHFRH